jgi:hypothetical protein
MESYIAKVAVPVLVPRRNIALDFGLQVVRNRVSYSVEYNYHYNLVEWHSWPIIVLKDGDSGNIAKNKTLTQWHMSPSIDLVLYLPYGLSATASASQKFAYVTIGWTIFD